MLNEETWIPFDVTYDVTAWSNPLLMNLDGGWSGDAVSPASSLVPDLDAPEWLPTADDDLDVLLLENERSTRGYESANQTAYLFRDVWGLPYDHALLADFDPASAPGLRRRRPPGRVRELRAAGPRREGQEGPSRVGQRRRAARRLAGRRGRRGQGGHLDGPVLDLQLERAGDAPAGRGRRRQPGRRRRR